MRTKTVMLGLALIAGLGAVGPVSAQGIRLGPDGLRVDPGYRDRDRGDRDDLTRAEAVRIARRAGLVDVDNVARRGPRFIVDGSDRRGDDITVVVDSRSGDVLDVRR